MSDNQSLAFIQDRDASATYCREIKSYRILTRQEEKSLSLEIQKGNKKALQTLIQANLKFVVAVCRNYAGRGLPFGDLISEGNLGLIRAAYRFDSSMNFKFCSYAVWWIRQGILTALAEQTRTLTLSTSRIEALRTINAATRKLEQTLQRVPNAEELAEATGKSAEAIVKYRLVAATPLSLNRPVDKEGGEDFVESLVDRNGEATDKTALQHLLTKKVSGMLCTLGEREQTVIRLYFGIGRDSECSLSEIGMRLCLTRERIRQIKDKALQRLLRPAKKATSAL